MKHDRAIHMHDAPEELGPFCAICRYGNTELSIYRGEWWCEGCIETEEDYEHDMSMGA